MCNGFSSKIRKSDGRRCWLTQIDTILMAWHKTTTLRHSVTRSDHARQCRWQHQKLRWSRKKMLALPSTIKQICFFCNTRQDCPWSLHVWWIAFVGGPPSHEVWGMLVRIAGLKHFFGWLCFLNQILFYPRVPRHVVIKALPNITNSNSRIMTEIDILCPSTRLQSLITFLKKLLPQPNRREYLGSECIEA